MEAKRDRLRPLEMCIGGHDGLCMLGREPDFNAFRRIVQGPESVAIGHRSAREDAPAVVVGRSNLVGRPVSILLGQRVLGRRVIAGV